MGQLAVPLNISNFVGDSYLRLSVNREFHLGYGRKIFGKDSVFALYGGVGAKYIQGIAMMQMSGDSAAGTYQMISAFSPGF